MNKNRILKQSIKKAGMKGAAVVLAISLAAGSISFVNAAPAEQVKQEGNAVSGKTENNYNRIYKEESVYINADAAGNVQKTIVSEWLKNSGTNGIITDISNLVDIRNIKGEETFQTNGSNLTWNASTEDIYYQGSTDKEIPVSMKITYKLDGKEMLPEEIAGKSGKLEMTVTYQNKSKKIVKIDGKNTEIYTPFAVVTGMMLSNDVFSHVVVKNGKLLSDGNKQIAVGIAFPGLTKSLGLEEKKDVELPEKIVLTADVKNFEMGNTLSFVTADFLNNFDFDKIEDTDDLADSLNQMTDASSKLVNGSNDLVKGLVTLQGKTGDFEKGIQILVKGTQDLNKGAGTLKSGIESYTKGTDTLAAGVLKYVDGAVTLSRGVKSYTEGVSALAGGVNQLAVSAEVLPGKLAELSKGMEKLITGAKELSKTENAEAIADGMAGISNGVVSLHDGIESVQDGISQINTNLNTLGQSYSSTDAIIQKLEQTAAAAADAETKAALEQMIPLLKETTEQQKQGIISLAEATDKNGKLGTGIETLAQSTKEGSTLSAGTKAVSEGVNKVAAGTAQLAEGLQVLQAGSSELAKVSESMPNAMKQLSAGASKLTGSNKALADGAAALITNGETLKKGAKELNANSSKLVTGAASLADGTLKLEKGGNQLGDGTKQLKSGVAQLVKGSNDLRNGMEKFDRTGIRKLKNALDSDLTNVLDRVKAICDAAKEYDNFAGKDNSMEGTVKFIMETAEIKNENTEK